MVAFLTPLLKMLNLFYMMNKILTYTFLHILPMPNPLKVSLSNHANT